MIILGIVLIIAGLLAPALHLAVLSILVPIGALILVVGLVLLVLGNAGHAVGGRRWY